MVSSCPNIKVVRGRVGSPAELRWREAIFNFRQFDTFVQDLVSYPYDLAEILHAALKWEVMTKCRSGKKNSVERFSRYCNFWGCWGAWKWVFGHFVKYLFSYPYDLAEIWHAALKWGVMTTCRSGRKKSDE